MTYPDRFAPLTARWPGHTVLLLALLALLIAILPTGQSAALLVATTATVLLLRWPVLGLYGLALALPVGPLFRWPLGPAAVGMLDVLLAMTVAAWFLRQVAMRPALRPTPLLWLLAPFATVLLFSTLAAQSLTEALPELVKWAEVLLLYFVAAQMLTPRHRLGVVLALLLAATGESLIGLRQFWLRIGPEAYQLGAYLRAYGTFGQPNPYAGYLGLNLPLGLALTLGWGQALSHQTGFRSRMKVLSFLLITAAMTLLIGLGLLASWSRGGWLGAVVAAIAVLALASGRSRMLLLAGAAATVLVYPLLPPAMSQRLSDIGTYFGLWNARNIPITDANFAILERVAHWQAAWEMFADHFWLGVGIGNWDVSYPAYAIPPWFDAMGHAHNVLFHYAAVAGIFGALSYAWMWLGSLAVALRSAVSPLTQQRFIAIGIVGLLLHLSIHNQFDNLFVQGMPLLFALALSLLPLPHLNTPVPQQ